MLPTVGGILPTTRSGKNVRGVDFVQKFGLLTQCDEPAVDAGEQKETDGKSQRSQEHLTWHERDPTPDTKGMNFERTGTFIAQQGK